jgi:transcription termination factor NusB
MSVGMILKRNAYINGVIDEVLEENKKIDQQINEILENVSRETFREGAK